MSFGHNSTPSGWLLLGVLVLVIVGVCIVIKQSETQVAKIRELHPDAIDIEHVFFTPEPFHWYEGGKNVTFYKITLRNGKVIYGRFHWGYDERPQ